MSKKVNCRRLRMCGAAHACNASLERAVAIAAYPSEDWNSITQSDHPRPDQTG